MLRRTRLPEIILLSLVSLGTLAFIIFAIFGDAFYSSVIGEDSVAEVLTALGYFGGFLTALYYLVKLPKAAKYTLFAALWATLCFVFFGEETSWLQHYLGYETPASVSSKNLQGEFNFHNLEGFMATASTGSVHQTLTSGEFDVRGLIKGQNLFRLGFLSYFVLLPLLIHGLIRLGVLTHRKVSAFCPLPKLNLVAGISFVIGISVVAYVLSPEARREITEVREMFYALFILFYVYAYLPRSSRQPAEGSAPRASNLTSGGHRPAA